MWPPHNWPCPNVMSPLFPGTITTTASLGLSQLIPTFTNWKGVAGVEPLVWPPPFPKASRYFALVVNRTFVIRSQRYWCIQTYLTQRSLPNSLSRAFVELLAKIQRKTIVTAVRVRNPANRVPFLFFTSVADHRSIKYAQTKCDKPSCDWWLSINFLSLLFIVAGFQLSLWDIANSSRYGEWPKHRGVWCDETFVASLKLITAIGCEMIEAIVAAIYSLWLLFYNGNSPQTNNAEYIN